MKATRPKDAGHGRSALYRDHEQGRWERIARGLYIPIDSPATDWDQLEAATRRTEATICLTSALVHHDLTDEIPAALNVAIPRGTRAAAVSGAIRWHHFDVDTFHVGRTELLLPGSSQTIGLYDAERSIVDCFRLRGAVGYEVARDAAREWLRRGGKPARLLEVAAQLPRAKAPVLRALEMLA